MPDAKTMPPGPADEAALQHARELVATGAERTADFWAALERRASELGMRPIVVGASDDPRVIRARSGV